MTNEDSKIEVVESVEENVTLQQFYYEKNNLDKIMEESIRLVVTSSDHSGRALNTSNSF